VKPIPPIYAPKGEYNLTRDLTKDLAGARNALNLTFTADWWHYELQRKQQVNATHEELIWFMGSNNTFLQANFTFNVWALKQSFKFIGGDQAKQCKVEKKNGWDFIVCNCSVNAFLKQYECGLALVG